MGQISKQVVICANFSYFMGQLLSCVPKNYTFTEFRPYTGKRATKCDLEL